MGRPRLAFYSITFCLLLTASAYTANQIQIENSEPGTDEWQLNNPAVGREIEGYASATSVNAGEDIKFYVSTASDYTLRIFRYGWYGGKGGREMMSAIARTGFFQAAPEPDPKTGLVECNWSDPYTLTIANDWVSGVYLAKLTAVATGKDAYIIFVVRNDARPSDFLFQSSVTTFQAYNRWGGKSLYDHNSSGGHRAYKVSFNRPYAPSMNPLAAGGVGAGEFLSNYAPPFESPPAAWECNMVRWLEREGYDVTYATNVDTHRNSELLLTHKAFLSVGHDEYWSWQMRRHVEAARDSGVNLAFFSANSVYWQIRFEPSELNSAPDRTVVCYKKARRDPLAKDPNFSHLRTIRWRTLGLPEDALVGVMYGANPVHGDIVVSDALHWVYSETGLKNGDRLKGLLGYEVDTVGKDTPPQTEILAHSPFHVGARGVSGVAHMTIYTATSGAMVFAAGTIQWAWGLDNYNASLRTSRLSPAAQQITRNILSRFASPPRRFVKTRRLP